jgi:hypothetical protein
MPATRARVAMAKSMFGWRECGHPVQQRRRPHRTAAQVHSRHRAVRRSGQLIRTFHHHIDLPAKLTSATCPFMSAIVFTSMSLDG